LQISDLDDLRGRLDADRAWAAFSIADLDPSRARHASWFGPVNGRSVVLVYSEYDPPIVIGHGDIDECDRTLSEPQVVTATTRAYLNVPPAWLPMIHCHFPQFEARRMVRMLFQSEGRSSAPSADVQRLGEADLDDVRRLYAEDLPAFFLPSQLREGVYYGVREQGALIAIAGTHVVSALGRVAALGNVHTRGDRRRRGLATGAVQAVTRDLREAGISTIVLNIVGANDEARRVYERIGFREYCVYYEGRATR
jgi:GNAT superfamily N-acetyltransferase